MALKNSYNVNFLYFIIEITATIDKLIIPQIITIWLFIPVWGISLFDIVVSVWLLFVLLFMISLFVLLSILFPWLPLLSLPVLWSPVLPWFPLLSSSVLLSPVFPWFPLFSFPVLSSPVFPLFPFCIISTNSILLIFPATSIVLKYIFAFFNQFIVIANSVVLYW